MPQLVSILPAVMPDLPLLFPQIDASYDPPPPTARIAPYDDGGIALGLDPCDDLEPRWVVWCAWLETP